MSANNTKAVRYLGLLDQALSNGTWGDVPELARKVEKHAPDRKALTTAARAEAQIASASHRPTSATSTTATSLHALSELIPGLKGAAEAAESKYPEDAFIALVCVAKIYWLQEDAPNALLTLQETSNPALTSATHSDGQSTPALGWSEVCAVISTLIKADSLSTTANQNEALQEYRSAAGRTLGYRSPELRKWSERLLARACMYHVKKIPTPLSEDLAETRATFKAWGDFCQRATRPPSANTVQPTSHLDIDRRVVWKAYYDILSTILQEGYIYNGTASSAKDFFLLSAPSIATEQTIAWRRYQLSEFRRVQSTYEALFLNEVKFPKSSQTNLEVEEWADQVIANWEILSGPEWAGVEAGDDKSDGISSVVLDILYRATTKTFHSTPILRHLFTVHAASSQYDLAMHAFDSYVDIVDRGKARAAKTGDSEPGLDDDDTAIATAAEAIRLLCRYGDRQQMEKAVQVGQLIKRWLGRPALETTKEDIEVEGISRDDTPKAESHLSSNTVAIAYRAIGISQAQSAHLTFEKGERSKLLNEANSNLRHAFKHDEQSIETAHALALVSAELRDISGAIRIIKGAIAANQSAQSGPQASNASKAAKLVPLWHLLALCLTARDDHEAAMKVCEAAFQQFGESDILVPWSDESSSGRASSDSTLSHVVDRLEGFHKESFVQVKMTQIALVELTEGPDEAVDMTDELLSLYAQLFGNPRFGASNVTDVSADSTVASPSKRGGTLKSLAGSIRPKSVKSVKSANEKDSSSSIPPMPEAPNGQAFGAPIEITVTNENGVAAKKHSEHRSHLPQLPHIPHLPHIGHHGHNSTATDRPLTSEVLSEKEALENARTEPPAEKSENNGVSGSAEGSNDSSQIAKRQAPSIAPTRAELRLAAAHDRRHKVSLLVEIWLFIAGVYIRSQSYEDAQSAIDDATRWTEALEIELARGLDGSNARRLFYKGWGGGRGVDESWADLWSVKAQLASAQQQPFDAMTSYEQALSYFPDHPTGIIGISNLLMDIFEEKIPPEEPIVPLHPLPLTTGSLISEVRPALTRPNSSATLPASRPMSQHVVVTQAVDEIKERRVDPSPAVLNRLAARDRAYMLLMNLSKLGVGWDNSEAWYALARAHELSREMGKAKNALWWVVELENDRPVRDWQEASPGGYTI